MRPLGWTLRHVRAKRKGQVRTLRGAICEPRRELSEETNPTDNLILDCSLPELWGKKFFSSCLRQPMHGTLSWQPQQTPWGWPVATEHSAAPLALYLMIPVATPQPNSCDRQKCLHTLPGVLWGARSSSPSHWEPVFQTASGHLCIAKARHSDCYLRSVDNQAIYSMNSLAWLPLLGLMLPCKLLLLQLK